MLVGATDPVLAVGLSTGGAASGKGRMNPLRDSLCHLFGVYGDDAPHCAIPVNTKIRLAAGVTDMRRGFNHAAKARGS